MLIIKRSFLLLILILGGLQLHAQENNIAKLTDSIENEGRNLYKSEIASWYGTDIFLEQCKGKRNRIGGYLSYDTGAGMANIFFSKDEVPVVLATMSFPYDVKPDNCKLDSTERKLLPVEEELYRIRKVAYHAISTNKDSVFRFYNNTGTNLVPLIIKGEKRVYVLTSPHANGLVLFGNDYLIRLDKNNEVISNKRLHNSLISASVKKAPGDTSKNVQVAAMHSHLSGYSGLITATDICTLMLYERFTTWKQYYVISKDYVSIWNCEKNQLLALTKVAWDKINEDQKQRHPAKAN
ncbi:hypothetical protein ACFGVR_07910 [Mucilaginibacter sp. AW1-3]